VPISRANRTRLAISRSRVYLRGRDLVLRVKLKDENNVISERALLFDREKRLDLPRCEFTSSVEVKNDVAYITIQSDKFARAVFVESDLTAGNFSDNFVDLFPGEPVTLTVNAGSLKADDIRESLRFTAVNNIEAHAPAACALKRLGAMTPPAHVPSWLLFKARKKMP